MRRTDRTAGFAVIHACEALGGGVLGVVQALANATARRGIPTVVLHGRRLETPADAATLFDAEVRLVEVGGWGRRSPGGVLPSARAAAALRSETARYPRGVLHLHSTFAGIVGRALPRRRDWRKLYTPHGYAFLNPSIPAAGRVAVRSLERRLGRRALTVACSATEAEVAREVLHLSEVEVVRNGIRLEASNAEPDAD
ncbi:MAG: glycosyltransferase family 4 protein, partial [Actinobacteria bacterium]|nr:glycosyltransferase family 4 protein [Actinomycetota bacterium]